MKMRDSPHRANENPAFVRTARSLTVRVLIMCSKGYCRAVMYVTVAM